MKVHLPCSTVFHYVLLCSTLLRSSTVFHCVLPCSTMFRHALLCSAAFCGTQWNSEKNITAKQSRTRQNTAKLSRAVQQRNASEHSWMHQNTAEEHKSKKKWNTMEQHKNLQWNTVKCYALVPSPWHMFSFTSTGSSADWTFGNCSYSKQNVMHLQ